MGEIFMPKMGDAMTEGKVIQWYKKPGDPVKKGEPLLEIETDKVNLDLEAEENGILEEISVEAGDMADVGATLATIRKDGEAASAKTKGKPKQSETPETPAEPEEKDEQKQKEDEKPPKKQRGESPEKQREKPDESQQDREDDRDAEAGEEPPADEPSGERKPRGGEGERVRSSPLARRMARELGVDLSQVSGSGPGGRVVAADIDKASSRGAADEAAKPRPPASSVRLDRAPALEAKKIPLTAMRRTIAKRLVESIGPIPHFFLTMEIDVTDLLVLRKQLNEIAQAKISVNDFVIRASALAILHHPIVNSSFTDEAIVQHGEVSIGVAVATPEGLITPVIRNADQKPVTDIATEVKTLAEKAKNRKLKPDEYQGATFTISNLGMFGIDEFTAIINPPNAAILAVGAAQAMPVVVDGEIDIRDRMKVTMSCDHRVVDGAAGAEFLQTLKLYLEQPLRIVL